MSVTIFYPERVSYEGTLPVDPDSPRHRVAKLDEQVKVRLEFAKRSGRASEPLIANLFEDASHRLVLDRAVSENGADVLRGRVEGSPDSRVVMTSDGETITLTVNTGDREYQVVPLNLDLYLIEEVSLDAVDCATGDEDDVSHGDNHGNENSEDPGGAGDDEISAGPITVLLLYTAAVKAELGGDVGMNAFVRMIFANLNTSLMDSQTRASVSLAALKQADLPGIPDSNCKATDFLADDPSVQAWRRQYKADLVSIIRMTTATSCADCLLTLKGSKSAAFSSISFSQARQRHSFSHEVGHNLGCAHDRANSNSGCAEPTGRGYRFQAGGKSRGTLMAYGPNRVNFFSNPDVTFMNVAVGTPEDNNAGTIRKTAAKVAQYGESL